jgi:hypothetical protein
MDLVLNCKVKKVGQLQAGTSKAGNPWQKRNYLVEEIGSMYSKEVYFYVMGTLCDLQLKEGDTITAHLEIRAREYQGKYYNEVGCFKIDMPQPAPAPAPAPVQPERRDDLPF